MQSLVSTNTSRKFAVGNKTPDHIALDAVWRNNRAQNDQATLDDLIRYFVDTPDVFHPIYLSKSRDRG